MNYGDQIDFFIAVDGKWENNTPDGKCYCRSWTFLRLLATVKRVGMHAMRFGDSKGAKTHHMQTASESWAACSLAHRTKCSRPDWLTHSYRQKTVDSMVLPHVDCVKAPCSNINNTSDYLEDSLCIRLWKPYLFAGWHQKRLNVIYQTTADKLFLKLSWWISLSSAICWVGVVLLRAVMYLFK